MALDTAFFSTWQPRIQGLLRIVTGYLFIAHGTAKLLGVPHVKMFDNLQLMSLAGVAGILELSARRASSIKPRYLLAAATCSLNARTMMACVVSPDRRASFSSSAFNSAGSLSLVAVTGMAASGMGIPFLTTPATSP